jgi:ABC-type transport system involved in Fe-S cluster assembly fused permease/ATPase subunit
MDSTESPKVPTIGIWYLVRFLKPFKVLVFFTFVFLLSGQIFTSLDPIWLKKIIDGIGNHLTLAQLGQIIFFYFALRVLSFVSDLLRDVLFAPAEMGIARETSRQLFDHLLLLPISFHVDQKIGGISRQITRGGRAVTFILDILVSNIFPIILDLVIVTTLLLRLYSPVYGIVTFLTVVSYATFTIWSTEKRQKFRVGSLEADDEVGSIEVDALTNIDTVKYFNNERLLQSRYMPAISKRYEMSVASNKLFAVISAGQATILAVGLGIILLLAIRQTISGLLTIGDLVLLTTYIVRLSAPINILGFIYRNLKDGFTDLQGMARILQEKVTVGEPTHPVKITKCKGKVTFDHVGFDYSGKRQILKDVHFTVQPGQRVAFVGPSGVGKSTIVKLLFRFFDPSSGNILIDDVNLQDLDKDSRRSIFAIVPQEPALFNSSIAENIRFGKPDATQKEIEQAAELANIAHFIEGLPEKYDTVVGERGVKLSGGEKQRVAIARAIIRDPKVLVFDEATSSLDSKNEKEIQESLNAIAKGRTTIAVAHRLSTIAGSDQIFVMNEGTIAEQGTHGELLAKGGIYAKLWEIQSHKTDDAEESE